MGIGIGAADDLPSHSQN